MHSGACERESPCASLRCVEGAECVRDESGSAMCACTKCSPVYNPVCGSDNVTYPSLCHLQQELNILYIFKQFFLIIGRQILFWLFLSSYLPPFLFFIVCWLSLLAILQNTVEQPGFVVLPELNIFIQILIFTLFLYTTLYTTLYRVTRKRWDFHDDMKLSFWSDVLQQSITAVFKWFVGESNDLKLLGTNDVK